MPATISGFEISDQNLAHWEPLLRHWTAMVERYCVVSDGDAPWLYMEEPNTSILAAAAWRCGWIALTESPVRKSEAQGYSDLWLCREGARDEYVEAKFGNFSDLPSLLETACTCATSIDRANGTSRIGIAFAFFTFEVDDDVIRKCLDKTKTDSSPGAMAWCFPAATRNFQDRGVTSPGVLLIAKQVD